MRHVSTSFYLNPSKGDNCILCGFLSSRHHLKSLFIFFFFPPGKVAFFSGKNSQKEGERREEEKRRKSRSLYYSSGTNAEWEGTNLKMKKTVGENMTAHQRNINQKSRFTYNDKLVNGVIKVFLLFKANINKTFYYFNL